MRGKSSRIGRSASGKVQFEFADRFRILFSQTGKGKLAVNAVTLEQLNDAVKFGFQRR
jgi:hypothetical protein